MKIGIIHILLLAVVISCFIDDSDAWGRRRRRRRFWRRVGRFAGRVGRFYRRHRWWINPAAKYGLSLLGGKRKLDLDTMARGLNVDKEDLAEAFDEADSDNDGFIDAKDYQRAMDEGNEFENTDDDYDDDDDEAIEKQRRMLEILKELDTDDIE